MNWKSGLTYDDSSCSGTACLAESRASRWCARPTSGRAARRRLGAARSRTRALVGTFLGVLLAYGLVGPFASRLKAVIEEEAKYHEVIRAVLVAHLHGNAPQVAVETGRKMVPTSLMPSFAEVEESLQDLKI